MPKSIKAPDYFTEILDKVNKHDKMLADILDVSVEWLVRKREERDAKNMLDFIKEKNLDEITKQRVIILLQIVGGYGATAWALFRYNNITNEFGEATRLHYNPKKERIEIVFNLKEFLEDMKKKIEGKMGGIINFKKIDK